MPSQLHETLVELFRNRPTLAAELLRDVLHFELPPFAEARVDSAELPDLHPADRRADLVVQLDADAPTGGIILEVQLHRDTNKRFVWPAYVCNLRARLQRPVYLLVVTTSEAIARWAAEPIDIGGGNTFRPSVLSPSCVPEILDPAVARQDPELAVLSAMAHGRDEPPGKAVLIAMAAQQAILDLDEARSTLYFDLIQASLSEPAKREFLSMDPAKYEYQSEFAKRYVAQGEEKGKREGMLEGKAELLVRQLSLRFGPLGETDRAVVANAAVEELDAIGERLIGAATLREALGKR